MLDAGGGLLRRKATATAIAATNPSTAMYVKRRGIGFDEVLNQNGPAKYAKRVAHIARREEVAAREALC